MVNLKVIRPFRDFCPTYVIAQGGRPHVRQIRPGNGLLRNTTALTRRSRNCPDQIGVLHAGRRFPPRTKRPPAAPRSRRFASPTFSGVNPPASIHGTLQRRLAIRRQSKATTVAHRAKAPSLGGLASISNRSATPHKDRSLPRPRLRQCQRPSSPATDSAGANLAHPLGRFLARVSCTHVQRHPVQNPAKSKHHPDLHQSGPTFATPGGTSIGQIARHLGRRPARRFRKEVETHIGRTRLGSALQQSRAFSARRFSRECQKPWRRV